MYQMLPVHVHVSNATVDCSCIKCYSNMFMYKMYLTKYQIFIKIGVSNYTSPLCQFLTVTFEFSTGLWKSVVELWKNVTSMLMCGYGSIVSNVLDFYRLVAKCTIVAHIQQKYKNLYRKETYIYFYLFIIVYY